MQFNERGFSPALLPEVWVHWDPVTKQRRGPDASRPSRIDLLMLLRNRWRVIIEVDGAQYYSRDDRPSPAV
jgi:hypothetical protein